MYEGCLKDYSEITEDMLEDFYNSNQDFLEYIDRCIDRKLYINKEHAFSQAEVKEAYRYYKSQMK